MKVSCARTRAVVVVLGAIILVIVTILSGCGTSEKPDRDNGTNREQGFTLPTPDNSGGMKLNNAISGRRSIRSYTWESLTRKEISQLLWAAQGVTDPSSGYRSAPSAGALYPLEVYFLEKGTVYHYVPESHSLEKVKSKADPVLLADAAMGQSFVAEAPVVFIISGVLERTKNKYGSRGERYVYMEAGHAAENMLLEAVSLGLGAVTVGSFEDPDVSAAVGLPGDETPLYLIPVGKTGLE